jgi:sulfatase maturation enzyme AslB (radical SAM superfamily)
MTIVDKAINLLKDGAKKVEFEWQGAEVTAYWVNKILRIDVKGLKED